MKKSSVKPGRYGPRNARLGQWVARKIHPIIKHLLSQRKLFTLASAYAQSRSKAFREKRQRGEPIYLLGIGPGGHNSGTSLVEVTSAGKLNLISNNEEERFTGIKHYADYPAMSVAEVRHQLADLGLKPNDIHACLTSWDYVALIAHSLRVFVEEFPGTLQLLKPQPRETFLTDHQVLFEMLSAPRRLGEQLGLPEPQPLINLRHHDNHAYFSWAVSPFAQINEPVMIAVIDGSGDDGSISLYVAYQGRIKLWYNNGSMFDSLGTFYTMLSATQGGWTPLSCEGRFMGASAWGDNDRQTNRYYQGLRHIFHLTEDGQVLLNRRLANWSRAGYANPYSPDLTDLLGPPILPKAMWNPDKVLRLDATDLDDPTQARLDKAAATQMVFEDALLHLIDHFIQKTGSHHLIFTGGTALNCIANMRLLDHFDEAYFAKHLGMNDTYLKLWVPPIPGDAGTPPGAAYHFALQNGAQPGNPLPHAFYCGRAATSAEIRMAVEADDEIGMQVLGNVWEVGQRERVADLLAYLVAQNSFVGLFQGVAETGPRALGHRSILANPCNPDILALLNQQVKFREPFRPLAPMVTLAAAKRLFELSPGASTANYNAYNYMILTARAKPEAHQKIPAVIHRDGTSRLQIVRSDIDPFTHTYLKAMGRYLGAEVSVNTSLNVGSPIVQTPKQALMALKRSKGLTALLMIGADGEAMLVWHEVVDEIKDGGKALLGMVPMIV